jgi:hypothetical protein
MTAMEILGALLLSLLVLGLITASGLAEPKIQVYFSPLGACTEAVAKALSPRDPLVHAARRGGF